MRCRDPGDAARASPPAFFPGRSGLMTYDAASWLLPPPPVRRAMTTATGVCAVVQAGFCDDERPQETLVTPVAADRLLILPDGAAGIEWHHDGRRHETQARLSIVAIGGEGHSRWTMRRRQGRAVHLHFPFGALAVLAPEFSAHRLVDRWWAPDASLGQIARAFVNDMDSLQPPSPLLLETYAVLIARKVLAGGQHREIRRGGLAPWQVRRVTEYLAAHLNTASPIVELAALVGLSPFHFARAFKQSTGSPPHAYQSALRLERAMALLSDTDQSVTDIAAHVGYETPQTLARVFQRHIGISPTAYRRQRR
jgi:AraC family transcriptional regulator